ncbi:lipoxygenase [Aspergillus varians]
MTENTPKADPAAMLDDHPLNSIDTGVFINELTNSQLLPQGLQLYSAIDEIRYAQNPENLIWKIAEQQPSSAEPKEVSYRETQLALMKTYGFIEHRFQSFMEVVNFDPLLPPPQATKEKRMLYSFTNSSDKYPPHLNLSGNVDQGDGWEGHNNNARLPLNEIFDGMRLLQSSTLMRDYLRWWLKPGVRAIADLKFGHMGRPDRGKSLKEVEGFNRTALDSKNDIFDQLNVGDLDDWWSDARFCQQQFTGTNPTTIERASDRWLAHFIQASKASEDKSIIQTIENLKETSRHSLYMQDYSYFRAAAKLGPSDDIKCKSATEGYRYGCASVCLFYLNEYGKLYPLAIVIDWRGTAEKSVTIFNRTLFKFKKDLKSENYNSTPDQLKQEADDWSWRYAKTCVQTSDWFRHEVTVHLVNTHFVEEAIIVASHRNLEQHHPVMQLLYPHWQKTLALNAAARTTLVPYVVVELVGFPKDNALEFIRNAYADFDFKKHYVPTDLEERGFPPEQLNEAKFHNYTYAKCINSMWGKIRKFVRGMLELDYPGPDADQKVADDRSIQAWVTELRSKEGGRLKFPTINTFDELVDCVTMCIHTASPQHTAVNYLQRYYQSFVVNKPSCLFMPPPGSLGDLLKYSEQDLVKALPMNHPAEWLLSSHIPYLLNKKPSAEESLSNYANSKCQVYCNKTSSDKDMQIAVTAAEFYLELVESAKEFEEYGKQADDSDEIPYRVLNPDWNAVSILI